jgi:prepilin-type N-terminal cleavage/methylation domain-containing protein
MKIFQRKNFDIRNAQGFSLLEMIVASSIFVIIMLVIVGALISLSNASRKARAVRLVTDNLSAAIDSMSRNIRMGTYYHCGCGTAGVPSTSGDANFPDGVRDCPMTDALGTGGDQCFAFEGPRGDPSISTDQFVYRLFNNRIQRSKDGGATFIDLTAPEINITDLHFFVYGTQLDQKQPLIIMLVRGTAAITPQTTTNFNIETTVEARAPNYTAVP